MNGLKQGTRILCLFFVAVVTFTLNKVNLIQYEYILLPWDGMLSFRITIQHCLNANITFMHSSFLQLQNFYLIVDKIWWSSLNPLQSFKEKISYTLEI